MTAHSGRGWQLAPSLIRLEAEANTLAPHRSQASDGSIGDAAHAARSSDHNIDGGFVHAIDLTHDPRGGFDAHAHARAVAQRADSRVKYVISNRMIWDPSRGWHPYTGTNPHDHHAHFSVWHTTSARNNLAQWLLTTRPDPRPPPPDLEDDEVSTLIVAPDGKRWVASGCLRKEVDQATRDMMVFLGQKEVVANQAFWHGIENSTVDANVINLGCMYAAAAAQQTKP